MKQFILSLSSYLIFLLPTFRVTSESSSHRPSHKFQIQKFFHVQRCSPHWLMFRKQNICHEIVYVEIYDPKWTEKPTTECRSSDRNKLRLSTERQQIGKSVKIIVITVMGVIIQTRHVFICIHSEIGARIAGIDCAIPFCHWVGFYCLSWSHKFHDWMDLKTINTEIYISFDFNEIA